METLLAVSNADTLSRKACTEGWLGASVESALRRPLGVLWVLWEGAQGRRRRRGYGVQRHGMEAQAQGRPCCDS